jgi:predicted lysophospholipase L1 biosynthesis ABC-type transport system permease subunit
MMIAIGVYAVAAVRLDARRVEIAIRRALGATNGRVVRRVCRLMWPALGIGLALGTALALIGVRLLASTVTELDVVAVSTYVWACAGTVSAAVAGMMLPLWRSLRADPGRILQEARS